MMKALSLLSLPLLFACVLAACSPAQTPRDTESSGAASAAAADPFAPNPPAGMKLVWGDEFNVDGRPDHAFSERSL